MKIKKINALDKLKNLGNGILKIDLFFSKEQINFLKRDLSNEQEGILWNETSKLLEIATVSFVELGRRFIILKEKNEGSFQAECKKRGLAKTFVETIINKCQMLDEAKKIGYEGEELEMVIGKVERLSQRDAGDLKKIDVEDRKEFFEGNIEKKEIKEKAKKIRVKEKEEKTVDAEIIDEKENYNDVLEKKKNIKKEIELLKFQVENKERDLKSLEKLIEEWEVNNEEN
jgi:hypothetical protein